MYDIKQSANQQDEHEEQLLKITYYSDPLCCWSWGFEPQWRRFRYEFRGKIKWRYRMCGMLPDWDSFNDPLNSVNRPLQMGPVWFEAKHISGMPMEDKVWVSDPPASSYPACAAVKCAGNQSPEAEEWYLRYIREALFLHGENIAKQEVLLKAAERLEKEKPHVFSRERFGHELQEGAGNDAFREDLQEARYHRIGRYPTLTIEKDGQEGIMMTGYRPYSVLLEAVQQLAPELQAREGHQDLDQYRDYWNGPTEREVQEFDR